MPLQSPNRRKACGQTIGPPPTFLGGCYNQFNEQLDATKIKVNVTKMKDYASASSAWIDPFPTIDLPQYQPACSPYSSNSFPIYYCGDGANGNLWCFQNIDDTYVKPCDAGSSSFDVGDFTNCYAQTNETRSAATCRVLGFKNVYASKIWQGRHSYTSNVWGKPDSWDWCGDGCQYMSYTPSADQTKYLAISANATYTRRYVKYHTDCGDPYDAYCPIGCTPGDEGCTYIGPCTTCTKVLDEVISYGGSAASNCSVDHYGNITGTCTSSSFGTYTDCSLDPDPAACAYTCAAYQSNEAFGLLGMANNNWNDLLGMFGYHLGTSTPATVTGGGGSWTLTFEGTYDEQCPDTVCDPSHTVTYTSKTISITPTTCDVYTYMPTRGAVSDNCQPICYSVVQIGEYHMSYGATSFHYNEATTEVTSALFGTITHEVEVNGTLSTPYTSTDVYNEMVALLSEWDMGDDQMYPWRQDSAVTKGPYVTHIEGGGGPSIPHCSESNYTGYSGKVLGSPAPVGMDRVWDFAHANQCVCTDEYGCLAFYTQDYGAWSTDIGVPRATHWLNLFQSDNMMDEAFVGSNFFWTFPSSCNSSGPNRINDDVLWSCKRAEVIFEKPSYNYARPCGPRDRVQISSSLGSCVMSAADNVLQFDPTDVPVIQFGATDKLVVCGVAGVDDGIYKGTRDSDYQVTLTEVQASSSWMVYPPIADCGSGVLARLRWPTGIPGFCGKIELSSVSRPNTASFYTASFEDNITWFKGDQIKIEGAKGLTGLNRIWTVLPLDVNNCVLQDSQNIGNQTYLGQGKASFPFGADWKWNDTEPKNEFAVFTWDYDFRRWDEWYRVKGNAEWNAGLSQCCCPNPGCGCAPPPYDCPQPAVPAEPGAKQAACGISQYITQMSCSTQCIPYNACRPMVAYFAPPNQDHFDPSGSNIASAVNYGWKNPGMDSQYGSLWQGAVKQSMDDPLFQAPPCTCQQVTDPDTEITSWYCNCYEYEDDGTCQADQTGDPDLGIPCIKYYAARNQYENRCEVPTGAPALPYGTKIGCLTTDDVEKRGCLVTKNVCYPPYPPNFYPYQNGCNPYVVYPWALPWITMLTKEQCVCNEGRFAQDYLDGGIGCPNVDILDSPLYDVFPAP